MQQKPNYTQYGLSTTMGVQLREFVEQALLNDLEHYPIDESISELQFDWSYSCIEGRSGAYLDGSFSNYSDISLYNKKDELVIEGWLEFIHKDALIIFWDFLDIYKDGVLVYEKPDKPSLPIHIRKQLPKDYLKNM
jgi:hypothetical protein